MAQYAHTLCWDCKNSTTYGCDWAREFIPVKGWEATETKNGYLITNCPEFVRDSWEFGAYRTEEEYKKAINTLLKIIKIDDMVISITIQGKEDFEIKIL